MNISLPKALPHTIAKHELLKNYLNAWLEIIDRSPQFRAMAYIDTCCSYGEYQEGQPGSPIWAYRLAIERERPLKTRTFLRFIDKDKKATQHLQQRLEGLTQLPNVDWKVISSPFEEVIDVVLNEIDGSTRGTTPLFVFLDPWGINIPFSIIERLLRRQSSEVFVYLNIPGIIRNLENPDGAPVVQSLYGTSAVCGLKHDARLPETLRDLYLEQLKKAAGSEHVFSFGMQDRYDNLKYYLCFATRNRLGFLKMKESMWRLDNRGEFRFSDADVHQQYIFQEPDLSTLREQVTALLRKSARSGLELNEFVDYRTMFLGKHKTNVLRRLEEDAHEIEVTGPPEKMARRKKGQFPEWCTVRWIGG